MRSGIFYWILEKNDLLMSKSERANILIVDDKAKNIFALEQVLSGAGQGHFIRAINGQEALKTVLNKEIDLIILDVQMPDMDGFEVAQILKSHKRTKDIPIIFASAEKKEHRFMMKGFEEGAVDYLYKPLDPAVTEAKVSVLLQLHLQKKELVRKNLILEKHALLINNSADLICIINARTLKFEEINYAVSARCSAIRSEEIQEYTLSCFILTERTVLASKTWAKPVKKDSHLRRGYIVRTDPSSGLTGT